MPGRTSLGMKIDTEQQMDQIDRLIATEVMGWTFNEVGILESGHPAWEQPWQPTRSLETAWEVATKCGLFDRTGFLFGSLGEQWGIYRSEAEGFSTYVTAATPSLALSLACLRKIGIQL
jgi:hypothetical protein